MNLNLAGSANVRMTHKYIKLTIRSSSRRRFKHLAIAYENLMLTLLGTGGKHQFVPATVFAEAEKFAKVPASTFYAIAIIL